MCLSQIVGEGNGTPLQYSCLENPVDGGAWWAAVHGIAEGRTRLSDFAFTFCFHALENEMATHSSDCLVSFSMSFSALYLLINSDSKTFGRSHIVSLGENLIFCVCVKEVNPNKVPCLSLWTHTHAHTQTQTYTHIPSPSFPFENLCFL